jgi:hypothetical protein
MRGVYMKSGLSRKEIAILIISVTLVAFFVFLPTWATYRATKLSGPRLIAQDSENRIWVEDNAAIYILDSDGKLLRTHYLEWLGITPPLACFCPLPDGDMLVGSKKTGLIHRIGHDLTTIGVIDLSETTIGRPFGAFHLLYDSERNEIYLSDTSNHRVIVIRPSGEILRGKGSAGTPGFFHFPNMMVIDKTGKILVADTNHHEIKVLSKDLELERTINPVPVSESHFVWPAAIGIDGEGRIYVVNYAYDMRYGALVRLDEEGEIETFPLEQGIMPASMLVRDKDVLLADMKDFTIYRIDSESREVSPFGSEALQNIFEASHNKVKLYHIIKMASRYLLVIFFFVLLIFLAIERRRRAATEKTAATMDIGLPEQTVSSSLVWPPIFAALGVMILLLVLLVVVAYLPTPFLCQSPATIVIVAAIILLSVACVIFIIFLARFLVFIRYTNNKIFNRHASVIRKSLPTDEPIQLLGICQIRHEPIFLVATNNRFILLSMSPFFTHIRGIQEVSLSSIHRVSMPLSRSIANKIGLARVRFIFSLSGLSKDFVLKFQDYNTAKQLLDMVETQRKGRTIEEPVIRSRCQTCCSALDLQGNCPSCGVRAVSMWKPILLSVLLPGLGQLYHRDLFKGCLFIIIYGLSIVFLLKPVVTLVHRFAAVDMIDLAMRIGTAFFVWMVSLINTIHIAYKNRYRRWGLRL